MVYRQTRLTARLLLLTILALAVWTLLHFGADHLLPGRYRANGVADPALPAWQAALRFSLSALLWMLVHEQAARVKRWRRNIIRAGGVFATSWIGSLTLILTLQVMQLARALGYDVYEGAAYATLIGVLLLFRANLLPKSRPAWFNGVALPVFASRPDVWCRVHRASALRLLLIGLTSLGLAAFAPRDFDPIEPIVMLLLAELALATAHALWLGATTNARKETAR